jgi:putative cardiolipin synthase
MQQIARTLRARQAGLRRLLGGLCLTAFCTALLPACASLPQVPARPPATAPADTSDTTLGRALAPRLAKVPGQSLFYPLSSGPDALGARLAMARAAERSLDLQTYNFETTGISTALLGDIIDAADRGVRVRLLIDDMHTDGQDKVLAAVDAHPNIQIRLFNPFASRDLRWLELALDFRRLNHRMHNKSMTVDNQLSVLGGRNVGDAYFSAKSEMDFSDLDVLIAGPAVPQVSAAFDAYWNDPAAYPLKTLIPDARKDPAQAHALRKRIAATGDQAKASPFVQEILKSGLARGIESGHMPGYTGAAQVIADKAEKIRAADGRGTDGDAIVQVEALISAARSEVVLVSPYFVPDDDGEAQLIALARRGVRVRVITNSFAATDVAAVHAGYAPHRRALVAAGVELYELKVSAYAELAQHGSGPHGSGWLASSRASLHAKSYMVDRHLIFIGSLNLDQRSARLNTEMGVVLDSPALCDVILKGMDRDLMRTSYKVQLRPGPDGGEPHLVWVTREDGAEKVYDSEPDMNALQKLGIDILKLLPLKEEL